MSDANSSQTAGGVPAVSPSLMSRAQLALQSRRTGSSIRQVQRQMSKTSMMLQKMKTKKKSLAKILFPPNFSASEMVKKGTLGKFVHPKKVSCQTRAIFFQFQVTVYGI